MGRYPWTVYGLMKIEDSVSTTVTGGMVLLTLIGFSLIYALLMAIDIYLLGKIAKAGPVGMNNTLENREDQYPSLANVQE